MKNLSIISSIIYVVALAVYSLFAKDNSAMWAAYFFINNSLYISLLLFDNALQSSNIKYISMIITAIVFQILFVVFELYLYIWCAEDYFKLINNAFWGLILFIAIGIFLITYKIIDKWENG